MPRRPYLVGALILLGVLMFAPGVIDWVSERLSDRVTESLNDLQTPTSTSP